MKNTHRTNGGRLLAIAAILLALPLALPTAAAAAQEGDVPANQMQVEYRFMEGEAPNIPATVDMGGHTYRLVSQSDPVLASSMPAVRTYKWRIEGALTPEQIEMIKGLGDIELTPVNVVKEREVDKEATFNRETNDVDDIPEYMNFQVTSGTSASGYETKSLKRAGVTYTIVGDGTQSAENAGLPPSYKATALYRGVETYAEPGYYTAKATFTTEENDGDDNVYVVTATYETDIPEAIIPPIDTAEPIVEPVEPEAALPVTNISDEDVARIAGQGPNLFQNLADGLVPLGNIFATGVWSLLSAIMVIAAIVTVAITAAGTALKRRHEKALSEIGEYEGAQGKARRRRGAILLALTVIAGILTLATWLLLDDFTFGMTWLSVSTVPVGILLAATIIFRFFGSAREHKSLKEDLDEVETYILDGRPSIA